MAYKYVNAENKPRVENIQQIVS